MIMKLPVEITVTNRKLNYRDMVAAGDIPEPRESAQKYRGYMVIKGKRLSIDYDELFEDGESASTSVMVEKGMALISRRGDINTNLVFRKGESCDCVCHNGYRNMNLRVNTKSLDSNLGPLGGKLNIDYTIEIMGNVAEKNSICVSVFPSDSAS